jgi:predicted ATP-binding protein involved in virulence
MSTDSLNPFQTSLQNIALENFRCFSKLEVKFESKLTVVVAVNGGGKTALLDAITLGWHHFLKGLDWDNKTKGIPSGDDRVAPTPSGDMLPRKPVIVSGQNIINNKVVDWQIDKGVRSSQNTSARDAQTMWTAGYNLRKQLQDYADQKQPNPPTLPVVGFYGTGRLWAPKKITAARRKKNKADTSPLSGYDDCLSPSSHFELFELWFERFSRAAQQEKESGEASPHHPADRITVVKGAIDHLLEPTGWHSLSFDFGTETVVAKHSSHGKLPVSSLSDGIRIMIGLVGDIAHRCTRLNHHLGPDAAKQTPGVIMIDEVDMHLHPEWQQLVLQALRDAFPLIQFIVTTHSPQVVSTVPSECLRILKDGKCFTAPAGTDGAEAQRILETVFQVARRPNTEMSRLLDEYLRLIDQRQWEKPRALELRAKLDKWSQGQEPRLLEADLQIENLKWEMDK